MIKWYFLYSGLNCIIDQFNCIIDLLRLFYSLSSNIMIDYLILDLFNVFFIFGFS